MPSSAQTAQADKPGQETLECLFSRLRAWPRALPRGVKGGRCVDFAAYHVQGFGRPFFTLTFPHDVDIMPSFSFFPFLPPRLSMCMQSPILYKYQKKNKTRDETEKKCSGTNAWRNEAAYSTSLIVSPFHGLLLLFGRKTAPAIDGIIATITHFFQSFPARGTC